MRGLNAPPRRSAGVLHGRGDADHAVARLDGAGARAHHDARPADRDAADLHHGVVRMELAVRALVGLLHLDDAVDLVEAGHVALRHARGVADEADDGLLAAVDGVGLDAVLAFEQFAERVDLVARGAVLEYEDHFRERSPRPAAARAAPARGDLGLGGSLVAGHSPFSIQHSAFSIQHCSSAPSCFANGERRLGSRPGAVRFVRVPRAAEVLLGSDGARAGKAEEPLCLSVEGKSGGVALHDGADSLTAPRGTQADFSLREGAGVR